MVVFPTRAQAIGISTVLLSLGHALADVPHSFKAGEPARASEVNQNFTHLDDAVASTSSALSASNQGGLATEIDCTSDSEQLTDALAQGFQLITILGGSCRGNLSLRNQDVMLIGQSDASVNTTSHEGGDTLTVTSGATLSMSNIAVTGHIVTKLGAVLTLSNVDWTCTGSDVALNANSTSIDFDNVAMTGCPSLWATGNTAITTRNGLSVEGSETSPAISLARSSSIDTDELTVSMNLMAGQETRAIALGGNSAALIQNATIAGSVAVYSSSLRLQNSIISSPVEGYPLRLDSVDNGTLHISNVDLSGLAVSIFRSSVGTISNSDTFSLSDSVVRVDDSYLSIYGSLMGDILIEGVNGSHIQLYGVETGPSTNEAILDLDHYSVASVATEVTAPNVDETNCGAASRIIVNDANICP